MTLVYETVMYWREARFVEARRRLWATLAPDVHYRVIALIGDRTFRGGTREAPDLPPGLVDQAVQTELSAADPWHREWQQRDAATVASIPRSALVLMTDADEFVDPRALPRILDAAKSGPVKLGMDMWYFGTRWRNPEGWRHPAAFFRRHMPRRPSSLRDEHERFPLVPDAGWHLSYFAEGDDDSKLSAFSHADHDTPDQRAHLARGRVEGVGPNWESLVDEPLTGPLAALLGGDRG